jgi:hypothetical protein
MSEAHIPNTLRQRVAVQGRHRCGYCLTSEAEGDYCSAPSQPPIAGQSPTGMGVSGLASPAELKKLATWPYSLTPTLSQEEQEP